MSAKDDAKHDNVFARWSRRKQAVRSSEIQAPDAAALKPDAAAADLEAEPADQELAAAELAAAEPEAAEPAEPLPRLEDLTAKSDLSAFLRKGVPKALRSAALRKMWSLDPAIRDYIGPSEYAWDFNQPGSMAGFGPLEPNDSIAEFLATMSDGMPAALAKAATTPEALPAPSPEAAAVPPAEEADVSPDDPAEVAPPAESPEPPHAPASAHPSPEDMTVAAGPAEEVSAAKPPRSPDRPPDRPRHGRAMPR